MVFSNCMYLLAICVSSYMKCFFKSFVHFYWIIFALLLLDCKLSLHIMETTVTLVPQAMREATKAISWLFIASIVEERQGLEGWL